MPLVSGLLLSAAATFLVLVAAPWTGGMSPLLLALALGTVTTSAVSAWMRRAPRDREPRWQAFRPGTAFTARVVLRAGIVLLGLRLSLDDVRALGVRGLVVVVLTLAVTFTMTLLAARRPGVSRELGLLSASGFAVCGAGAISAMTATVERGASREDAAHTLPQATAAALAMVTLYGTLLVLAVPVLAGALGLSDAQAGLWIGAALPETAQVVAAGGVVSAPALATATVAKLARVALLAPLVADVGAVWGRTSRTAPVTDGTAPVTAGAARRRSWPVPPFILLFLTAVLLRSAGAVPDAVLTLAEQVGTGAFVAAMFALGLGIDVPRLLRTGGRLIVLGAAATAVVTGTSLLAVLALT